MDSSRQMLIVFTICSTFFLHSFSPISAAAVSNTDAAPSKLIEKVCSHESPKSEYTFCVKVLGSHPKAKAATNLVDLAKIILQIGASNATSTQKYIQKLINLSQPKKKQSLKVCIDAYKGVVIEFRGAIREMEAKDYDMAYYACGIAGDEGKRCEDEIASSRIRDSAIIAGNKFVHKFSLVGLSVTDLLS